MKEFILAVLVVELSASACYVQSQRSTSATRLSPDSAPFRSVHLPVGTHPTMLTVTDVNNDKNVDILSANGDGGSVSVYLGDGKGFFSQSEGSPFTAGQNPADIATADFNSDGNQDIAIANHGVKLVTVLLGNGNGQFSFAPGSPFPVESNPHPHGIAVADFNEDKKPDIAIDSWAENKVLLMFGKGDGAFQTPGVKFDAGKMPYHRLGTADVDQDGNADIVTSNFEGASVSVLFGDGRGQFTRKDFPAPPNPFGVVIAELNGDRNFDIAVFHYSGHATDRSKNGLSLLLGDGRRNFTLAQGSLFPVGQYPSTIAAGDLNGDNIADVVIPNYEDGTLTVYFGGRNGITQASYSPIRVGHTPHGVAIADLNHDGKGDIVVTEEEDNDVLILLSK